MSEFGECYRHQVHEPQDKLTEELPESRKNKKFKTTGRTKNWEKWKYASKAKYTHSQIITL